MSVLLLVLGALSASATSAGAVTSRGESAKQLVQAAAKALASARSLRMSGTIAKSGGSTAVDLELFSNGDVDGSLTIGGLLIHVTVVDGTDYFQASAAYWQKDGSLSATLAKSIAPDWISFPNSGSNGFGTSFEILPLASSLKATTGLSIVGHKKVDGHAAVGVKCSGGSVLWIAASGTPYPIVDSKQGTGGGTLTFGGWNSFKLPKAPSKAIALSSLSS
ncbi:MAG: hypothetical protein WB383_09560 [Acidimicrobiales bacterium]